MSFDPNSTQAIALQRKPVGSSALEVLIALCYSSIAVFVTANIRDNEGCDHYHHDSFVILHPQTFTEALTTLSSLTSQRLMDAMLALEKRGWVEKIPVKQWINKTDENRTTKFNAETLRRRDEWSQKSRGSYTAQRLSYQITPRGEQALAAMPTRVENFWREKNAPSRYLIAASEAMEEQPVFASGIYRIERETEERVFVTKETMDGACAFEGDTAVQEASTYSRVYGFYINKDRILLMDAQPEDFNQLYEVTEQARKNILDIEREYGRKIFEIGRQTQDLKTNAKTSASLKTEEILGKLQTMRSKKEAEHDEGFVIGEEDLGGLRF